MAKLTDKLFNRVIEGKFVAQSGDELPKELPAVSAVDNGKALVVSGGKWVAGTISAGTQLYKHTLSITGRDDMDSPTSWTVECIHYLSDVFTATSENFVKLSKALSMTFNYNSPCWILGNGKFIYLDDDENILYYNLIDTISDVVTPL